MANPIESGKNKNTIIVRDKKGIVSQLLDSEFKSGIFLEREKLIKEFVDSIESLISNIENIDVDGVRRAYLDVYWLVKLKREYQEKLK